MSAWQMFFFLFLVSQGLLYDENKILSPGSQTKKKKKKNQEKWEERQAEQKEEDTNRLSPLLFGS